ncbi:protein of unknown function [Methylocaldum szegediense]|uniref:Uncharacterized protein n=1 Tax=Methylocaldum szegediense TaxID=73780 RepID=A0ABM9I6K8_9GAMM|nr:protein of unknown function [Methylocaldum szegediense]
MHYSNERIVILVDGTGWQKSELFLIFCLISRSRSCPLNMSEWNLVEDLWDGTCEISFYNRVPGI